jgi:hypothetical protein
LRADARKVLAFTLDQLGYRDPLKTVLVGLLLGLYEEDQVWAWQAHTCQGCRYNPASCAFFGERVRDLHQQQIAYRERATCDSRTPDDSVREKG